MLKASLKPASTPDAGKANIRHKSGKNNSRLPPRQPGGL